MTTAALALLAALQVAPAAPAVGCAYVRTVTLPGVNWSIDELDRLSMNDAPFDWSPADTEPDRTWHVLTTRQGRVYAMFVTGVWYELTPEGGVINQGVAQSPAGCPAMPPSAHGTRIVGNVGYLVDAAGGVWTVVDPPINNILGAVIYSCPGCTPGERFSGSVRAVAAPPEHPFALAHCGGLIIVHKDGTYFSIDPFTRQFAEASLADCGPIATAPPHTVDCTYVRTVTLPGVAWSIDELDRLSLNDQPFDWSPADTEPDRTWHLLTTRQGRVFAMFVTGVWYELTPEGSAINQGVAQSPAGCPVMPPSADGTRIVGNVGYLVDSLGGVWTVVDPPINNILGAVIHNCPGCAPGERFSGSVRAIAAPPEHPFALAYCGGRIIVHKDATYFSIDPFTRQFGEASAANCGPFATPPPRPPGRVGVTRQP